MKQKSEIIRQAAQAIAKQYAESDIFMYGDQLHLPERKALEDILHDLQKLIFPAYFGDKQLMTLPPEQYSLLLMGQIYEKLEKQVRLSLQAAHGDASRCDDICQQFFAALPEIQALLMKDLQAAFDGDPAASSKEEVLFAYPGLYAIFVYRVAHALFHLQVPMLPRIMTEHAHSITGIDIHPGATIGEYFFIDHGTGIVVGETTIIGNGVKMYQGTTLGALSTRGERRHTKRHPTVCDNVTIYAGSTILGGETIIGENAVVGGNSFLTASVEKNSKVRIKPPEMYVSGGEK